MKVLLFIYDLNWILYYIIKKKKRILLFLLPKETREREREVNAQWPPPSSTKLPSSPIQHPPTPRSWCFFDCVITSSSLSLSKPFFFYSWNLSYWKIKLNSERNPPFLSLETPCLPMVTNRRIRVRVLQF